MDIIRRHYMLITYESSSVNMYQYLCMKCIKNIKQTFIAEEGYKDTHFLCYLRMKI